MARGDRREALVYRQWEVFARVVEGLRIEHKLLAAVYYVRRRELGLPGSNLNSLRAKLDDPRKLVASLVECCPQPENPSDVWAAAQACRYFQRRGSPPSDGQVLVGLVPEDTEESNAWLEHEGELSRSDISIALPENFRVLLFDCFRKDLGRDFSVVFAASPISTYPEALPAPAAEQKLEHVSFIYVGSVTSSAMAACKEVAGLMQPVRDLMGLAVLASEFERETVWQERLRRIVDDGPGLCITKPFPGDVDSMKRQVLHIRYLARHAEKAGQRQLVWPRPIPSEHDPVPHYRMPRYDLPSFRELLCAQTPPPQRDVEKVLSRLLECLFDGTYVATRKRHNRPSHYWVKREIDKRRKRIEKLLVSLRRVLDHKPVMIGGSARIVEPQESHRAVVDLYDPPDRPGWAVTARFLARDSSAGIRVPSEILDGSILSQDPHATRLGVLTTCAIHGDLHFGNVLLDTRLPADPVFVLLDPAGVAQDRRRMADPAADIAKLLFSCEIGYDFVDAGLFDVHVTVRPNEGGHDINVAIPSSRPVIRELAGGATDAVPISVEPSLGHETRKLYEAAGRVIRLEAGRLAREKLRDANLVDRADFYAGLYCLALAPNHYFRNPEGALALLVKGCDMLDSWVSRGGG